MAFSFGGASPFGAASTPAFGAASSASSLFGASSAGSFSFSSAPASTPAFGAAAPAPGLFGAASSASAFGAASTPSLFGATSTPAFGAPASAPALGAASAPAATPGFALSSTPAFNFSSAPAAASAPSLFGQQPTPTLALGWPGAQQQQQQQPNALITYSTRYDDLHPDRQKELLEIQREISNCRADCEKLDLDMRLHDSAALKRGMEEETAALKQSLQGMLNAVTADDEALGDFRNKTMALLRSTEVAVRTFQRSRLWREAPNQYKGALIPPQVQELLSSPVVLPSPYLEAAVAGFADTLEGYRRCISELEQAVPPSASLLIAGGVLDESQVAQSLPTVISHMHDFFVHVAARMERLHAEIQRCKGEFLSHRQAAGDMSDPFQDSRRTLTLQSSSHANRPVVIPPATHHHQHASAALPAAGGAPQAGMLALPAPPTGALGAPPATPGFGFGTPLTPGAVTPFGGPINPAAADMSRKQSASGSRRKGR